MKYMKILWIESPRFGSDFKEKLSGQRKLVKSTAAQVSKKRPIDSNSVAGTAMKKQRILNTGKTEEREIDQTGELVELDDRTAQILEEELQGIMIKVWQALPDNPPLPAERYVAERLRIEASDDIRNQVPGMVPGSNLVWWEASAVASYNSTDKDVSPNDLTFRHDVAFKPIGRIGLQVLGLNVTKRLLNVYNPLLLKVMFSGKPDATSLKRFMKNYNIKEFRQHKQQRNIYIARVHDIADFDRLCVANTERCGKAIVTVKPSYRFSQCPANLSTAFVKKNKTPSTSKENEISTDIEKEVHHKSSKVPLKDIIVDPAESKHDNSETNIENQHASNKNKVAAQNETKANAVKKLELNQHEVEKSNKNIKVDSTKKSSVTPNKVPDPTPTLVEMGIENIKKTSPQSNVSKQKQVPQATTVKKDTTPANKPKSNQEVATKHVTESTSRVNPTAPTNIKPKINLVNHENVESKLVTNLTPKSTEKPTVTSNMKQKQNMVSQEVVTSKVVTEPITKSPKKPTAPTNIKLQPIQAGQEETKKVTPSNQKVMPSQKYQPTPFTNMAKSNVSKPKLKQVAKLSVKDIDFIHSEPFDETDEMDDEEILALISTGVVVDECSGSDEE